jgi:hypothetical protein
VLPVTSDAVRLFLHVLAATIWVGGQIVLAGLVPVLRESGRETVGAAARRFQLLAWPAWVVLFLTGLWNLDAAGFSHQPDAWQATAMAKIGAWAAAGAFTAAHTVAGARAGRSESAARLRAVAGATAGFALLASLAALFWGVSLGA